LLLTAGRVRICGGGAIVRIIGWEKEQGKEKKRKEKNPAVKVRKDWSPADNSLTAFFAAHAKLAKKVQIVGEEKPHLIDLLEPMKF